MIYGYIRVSTDKQTVENQRFEIKNYCEKNSIKIDKWLEETASGTKQIKKRRLGILLYSAKKDDVIIASEISRFGRSLLDVMAMLNKLLEKEVNVITIKDNYRLDNSIQSKVLAFSYSLSAEIERQLLSQRTKEALARCKAEGIRLGRPPKPHKMHGKVIELYKQGFPKKAIGIELGLHNSSVYRILKETSDNGK